MYSFKIVPAPELILSTTTITIIALGRGRQAVESVNKKVHGL